MTTILGIDLGTTTCKVGLFGTDGSLLCLASRPTPTSRQPSAISRPPSTMNSELTTHNSQLRGHPQGAAPTGSWLTAHSFHDPQQLWQTVASAIQEIAQDQPVEVVGVASMAEAGLLVDRATGEPRSDMIPWYDRRSTSQAEEIAREDEPLELFRRSGLRPSFKYGLAKLLWLREQDAGVAEGTVWLSVADYFIYRLTGRMVTDPSLAARTYAFRIQEGVWDDAWIRHFGLDVALFPEVLPAGTPAATVTAEGAAATGLTQGTPVANAGHDHICASVAAGIIAPGPVLDSIGTAESLLGMLDAPDFGEKEFESGLSLVPHALPGCFCWLGGLSAAGGSIEWLRVQLSDESLSYERLEELAREAGAEPTGIRYVPHLSGSGGPAWSGRAEAWSGRVGSSNGRAPASLSSALPAAFIGLDASHQPAHLAKAVLEGTAYEIESLRRSAERLTGPPIEEIIAVGGGTRNRTWLQIKADVSGCRYRIPPLPEATALGAALITALGAGIIAETAELERIASHWLQQGTTIFPDPQRHSSYRHLFALFNRPSSPSRTSD